MTFFPMKFLPRSVYQTPNPEFDFSEGYSIMIESLPNRAEPGRCWIVRETHGWYDEATKSYLHKVETLRPTQAKHFMTFDEAQESADKQILLRANGGFRFLFTIGDKEPWHKRFEVVIPSGEFKPLP